MRPAKWKRWSKARREEHRGRMWGHTQAAGTGQVKVQVGAGQVAIEQPRDGRQACVAGAGGLGSTRARRVPPAAPSAIPPARAGKAALVLR